MKKYYLKLASSLFALMMPWVTFAQTKEVYGKVVDEKGEAIPFVNAVLLSLPDSTIVQGTVLSNSGTAAEMLSKIPGMTSRDDKLEVIGKGAPVFYINGRKVQDVEELKNLHSDEIHNVEVVTNPGATYDATVSSVVRIRSTDIIPSMFSEW